MTRCNVLNIVEVKFTPHTKNLGVGVQSSDPGSIARPVRSPMRLRIGRHLWCLTFNGAHRKGTQMVETGRNSE